jgi:Tol biopolymer transport system component
MLSGKQAFAGDTPASVIAAVLEREPAPLAASSDLVAHPALDAFIRTCLAKNPEDRWSSGHDLWLALRRLTPAGEPPKALAPSTRRSRGAAIPWAIAGLSLAIAVTALYRWSSPPAAVAASAVQAFIEFPNAWLENPRLSPDGRYLSLMSAFGVEKEGRRIVVRRVADGEATWLAGTAHAEPLAWSPDSRSMAVVLNGEIKAVDIATGGIRTIGRAPDDLRFLGSWNGENILLGGPRLRRMSVADGHVTDVYRADPEVSFQVDPSFLPDGRRFLYSQESKNAARRGVFLGKLDSSEVTRLLTEPVVAIVSPRGYLLYGGQGTLFAQRFDLDHNRLAGDPVSIGSDPQSFFPLSQFDVSGDTLVFSSGSILAAGRLIWFDRDGRRLNEIGDVRRYYQIALAPDGQRVVAGELDTRSGSSLFLIEPTRNIHARLTMGDQPETNPVWSPDSREVAFNGGDGDVFKRRIDQNERTTLLAAPVSGVEDWTHDGRFVIFGLSSKNISALPLGGDRKPIPLIESSSAVDEPHVSRDGRWLAYSTNDTGQWEVYMQPFMRPGGRVRVSTNGGSQPRWRADGKELFYLTFDGAMMSVDTRDAANPGAPRKLFETRFWVNPVDDQYDVTADGQRFLMIVPEGQQATRLTVLTNWPSVLTGR